MCTPEPNPHNIPGTHHEHTQKTMMVRDTSSGGEECESLWMQDRDMVIFSGAEKDDDSTGARKTEEPREERCSIKPDAEHEKQTTAEAPAADPALVKRESLKKLFDYYIFFSINSMNK